MENRRFLSPRFSYVACGGGFCTCVCVCVLYVMCLFIFVLEIRISGNYCWEAVFSERKRFRFSFIGRIRVRFVSVKDGREVIFLCLG